MHSVLFLDFDGVLHPTGGNASGAPFGRLPLLEAMLRETRCAAVRIVVSSTWREAYSLSRLRSVFAPDLRARVIDVTPTLDDYDGAYARWHEIRAWLALHPEVERYAALDDMVSGFPVEQHRHVAFTDGSTGLREADLVAVRKMLGVTQQ